MKTITKYICEICNTEYVDKIEAEACEHQGLEKALVKIGDIVFVTAGYGWYDGDERWVMNLNVKKNPEHGNCFGKCCTMAFYYVVTAIDQYPNDLHRIRYHVWTNAMTGENGHKSGWICRGHHIPKLVKNPPEFVVKDSKKLIGKITKFLL